MLRTATHLAATAGFLSAFSLAVYGPALADNRELGIAIAPGAAEITLIEWSRQTNLQVLFDHNDVLPYRTAGISGPFTPLDALGAMLRGTALTYDVVNPRSVAVIIGTQYCQPWLGAHAPLPPCQPGLAGGTL